MQPSEEKGSFLHLEKFEKEEVLKGELENLSSLDKEGNFYFAFLKENEGKGIMQGEPDKTMKKGKLIIVDKQKDRSIDLADLVNLSEFNALPNEEKSFKTYLWKEINGAHPSGIAVILNEAKLKQNPKNIFIALHELGHIRLIRRDLMLVPPKLGITMAEAANTELSIKKGAGSKRIGQLLSNVVENERKAWVEAIRMAREIKSKYGLDLFDLFKNTDDFMGFIHASLSFYEKASYGYGGEPPTKMNLVRKQMINRALENIKAAITTLF